MALAVTDKQVRTATRSLLETASGATTRVVPRWLVDLDPTDWASVVRSLTNDSKADGWMITRAKARSRRIGVAHWQHEWTYALWYFRGYRQGTDASNSEDELNVILAAVVQAFEDAEQLGFTGSEIDYHDGIQINSIDTVDTSMHLVMAELVVTLTSQ